MSRGYDRKDPFYRKAKEQGFRSRASFKLVELDKKYRLLREGNSVLDLGCYPGGWLQVAQQRVGPTGRVVGVDIREVEPVEVEFKNGLEIRCVSPTVIVGDVADPAVQRKIESALIGFADVLLSDMSPQLTGVRFRDVTRSAELIDVAFRLADRLLREGGCLVAKAFPGPETDDLFRVKSRRFERFSRLRLKSTRRSSSELYFIGKGFRRGQAGG